MAYIVESDHVLPQSPTREDVGQYTSELLRKRAKALKNPVENGMSFNLLYSPPSLSSPPLGPLPTTVRSLPTWFGKYRVYRVELQLRLRPYDYSTHSTHISEIWKARLTPALIYNTIEPDEAEDPCTPTSVIVKLVQPSMIPFPTRLDDIPDVDQMARSEAAAYDLLSDLQGTSMPYFFGKQPVRTISWFIRWQLLNSVNC